MGENSDEKKHVTIEAITVAYLQLIDLYKLNDDDIELDEQLVIQLVERYWMDVKRLKCYHPLDAIDCHKIAGYLTYWICKFKPIKVKNTILYETEKCAVFINELLAIVVSSGRVTGTDRWLVEDEAIEIKKEFFLPFLYTLRNRPINADSLSLIYYLIEENSHNKKSTA